MIDVIYLIKCLFIKRCCVTLSKLNDESFIDDEDVSQRRRSHIEEIRPPPPFDADDGPQVMIDDDVSKLVC